jgi:hypothetical protein
MLAGSAVASEAVTWGTKFTVAKSLLASQGPLVATASGNLSYKSVRRPFNVSAALDIRSKACEPSLVVEAVMIEV